MVTVSGKPFGMLGSTVRVAGWFGRRVDASVGIIMEIDTSGKIVVG